MGIDPAPFWENPLLYFMMNKFLPSLISSGSKQDFPCHGIVRFIDDLCVKFFN